MLPQEVFLSHSDQDRQFVIDLDEMLRRHGVPVWYSRNNLIAGRQWNDEIGAALHRCDWFILVLSPNALESMWVKREFRFALFQNRLENHIIPVLYQPCDYERLAWAWTLTTFQMTDFTQSFEQGCHDLLRVWGLGYRPD